MTQTFAIKMNVVDSPVKRFLVIAVVGAIIAVIYATQFSPQPRNLKAIGEYLSETRPKWEQFIEQNGYTDLKLYRITADEGSIMVSGSVATEEDLRKVVSFIESTNPPRPLFTEALEVIPDTSISRKNQDTSEQAGGRQSPKRPESE